jgi:hypothetical protein
MCQSLAAYWRNERGEIGRHALAKNTHGDIA